VEAIRYSMARLFGFRKAYHIPDPENEPLVRQRVTGFERSEERGVILETWLDSFGYYYYRDARHNLPREP